MNGIWKSPKVFNIITLYRSLLTAIPDNILSKPSLASPNTRDKKFLKTFLRGNPKYCWNYMALAGHFKRQNKDAWKTCLTRWFGLARINISRTLIQKWLLLLLFFFLIGIHPMQGWTATTRHGVTRKEAQKGLQDTGNLFRKNLQLKDVC